MKLTSKLLDILRDRLHKQPPQPDNQTDIPADPQVTQALADKIVEDARKHRLAIEGENGEEDR
jgi:hypothetical protein